MPDVKLILDELEIDDNRDITLLIKKLLLIRQRIVPKWERLMVTIWDEEVNPVILGRKK